MFDSFDTLLGIRKYKHNPECIFDQPIFLIHFIDTEYRGHKYKKKPVTILKNVTIAEQPKLIDNTVYHCIHIPETLSVSAKEQITKTLIDKCLEKGRNYVILDSNFYYE